MLFAILTIPGNRGGPAVSYLCFTNENPEVSVFPVSLGEVVMKPHSVHPELWGSMLLPVVSKHSHFKGPWCPQEGRITVKDGTGGQARRPVSSRLASAPELDSLK